MRDQHLRAFLGEPQTRPGIAATAYDTAWVASIPRHPGHTQPRFPATLQWLIEHQRFDGSWGGAVRYEHDRILSTLAALGALARFGRGPRASACLESGTRYLWQHGRLIASEPMELVAFELLLPALIQRAQLAGIAVPPGLDIYEAKRAKKLCMIPGNALYSPNSPLVHSIEFLGDEADPTLLKAAQGANGSLGNSPAATAFFLSFSEDWRAQQYLQHCLGQNGGAAAPVAEPCETFELLWVAYHLLLARVPAKVVLNAQDRAGLRQALASGGVSFSSSFPIVDADDTAVALVLLHDLGEDVDPSVLQAFALPDGYFATYPQERHSSVGTNLHVLHALLRVPGYPERAHVIKQLVDYVIDQRIDGAFWLDKWHISPYYATAHALRVLAELPADQAKRIQPAIGRAREWLRETQNADGSWGFYDQPTVEETAYGLLALTAGARHDRDCLPCDRASQYLQSHAQSRGARPCAPTTDEEMFPPLWIEKCLYTPKLIVQATIESALLANAAEHALSPAQACGSNRAQEYEGSRGRLDEEREL